MQRLLLILKRTTGFLCFLYQDIFVSIYLPENRVRGHSGKCNIFAPEIFAIQGQKVCTIQPRLPFTQFISPFVLLVLVFNTQKLSVHHISRIQAISPYLFYLIFFFTQQLKKPHIVYNCKCHLIY